MIAVVIAIAIIAGEGMETGVLLISESIFSLSLGHLRGEGSISRECLDIDDDGGVWRDVFFRCERARLYMDSDRISNLGGRISKLVEKKFFFFG